MDELRPVKPNEIIIDRDRLSDLLARNAEYDNEMRQLYNGVLKIFGFLGLADMDANGNEVIKAKVFQEKGLSIRDIGSGLKSSIGLFIQAGISKKAEQKLEERLSFMKPLFPLLEKYAREFSTPHTTQL